MANDKSREKLNRFAASEITSLFESALDYAQVACPPDNYKALRSKILRVGNNCIRNFQNQLERYDIEYMPISEDLIEFNKK